MSPPGNDSGPAPPRGKPDHSDTAASKPPNTASIGDAAAAGRGDAPGGGALRRECDPGGNGDGGSLPPGWNGDPTATITLRTAALSYAAENLSVFPLLAVGEPNPYTGVISDGKKPATRNGFYDATTGPDEITAWWNEHPHRNIGCRPPPGVVVLDIDPRKGGDDDMHKLVAEHGPFPATWVAATGGGGWHYWLRTDADPADILKNLCPGIELKHWAKGYVCMPPSIHESGRTYRWINPAEAPW